MAEECIGNLGYESPQSDTERQKLLKCVLTGNSKLYLGKTYTEDQLAKFNEEEVEKLFKITKKIHRRFIGDSQESCNSPVIKLNESYKLLGVPSS